MYIGIALTEQRSSEIQVKVSVVVVLGSVFTRVHSFGDVFSTFWCLVLIFFRCCSLLGMLFSVSCDVLVNCKCRVEILFCQL